jgi:hypothetical protein
MRPFPAQLPYTVPVSTSIGAAFCRELRRCDVRKYIYTGRNARMGRDSNERGTQSMLNDPCIRVESGKDRRQSLQPKRAMGTVRLLPAWLLRIRS